MKRAWPWMVAGVFALWILSSLRMPRDQGWAIQEFGRLPVVSNGRFQPIDSLARNSLLQLREKQSIHLGDENRELSATEWLMEVMMDTDKADSRRAFRVDHPEVRSLLKLPNADPAKGEDGKHYSWKQIKPGLRDLEREGKRIAGTLTFSAADIVDLPSLASKLKQPTDAISSYLKSLMSGATLSALENYTGPGSDRTSLRAALADDFGGLIGGPTLYDPQRFAGVTLRQETQQLLAQRLQGAELLLLNKLLLEDAYPEEISRKRIAKIDPSQRTPFERAVVKLQESFFLYMRLKNTMRPEDAKDFEKELAEYLRGLEPGIAAVRAKEAGKEYDHPAADKLIAYLERFDAAVRMEAPLLLPPHHPERSRDEWMRMGEALMEVVRGEALHPAVKTYASMASAFQQGRVADFNKLLGEHRQSLSAHFAPELAKAQREAFFNQLQVFYKCSILYVVAFLLACFSWFNLSDGLRRSAVLLVALGFIIHTGGLIFRMVLEGRPPVTNLYSSAIFIGWGAVVLGMVLERFYRDGIGTVVASSMGFITLIIAHNLAIGGDTMEMMRAVLDTNFWLATHVVVVTLGYASTFVAGFLAIVYLARGVFTRTLSEATAKSLNRMIYGIICFATLFSFVGTVLGGIWADQSWGRFWGWDPKENGALIIVIWNALILHARWGGMVRERGLANLAIVGNIVTAWSWFGVNMLGIGLHSYGFMDSAFRWLMLFNASQLILLGLGLLPRHLWLSFRRSAGGPTGPDPIVPPVSGTGGQRPASART